MQATDDGVFIEVSEECLIQLGWIDEGPHYSLQALARNLMSHSSIGEAAVPLRDVGLNIQAGDDRLIIGSGSPESLIRLSAYIVQGSRVVLKGAGDYELTLRLPKSGTGKATSTVVASDEFASGWMNVEGFGAPKLNDWDVSEIVNWALPHESWISHIKEREV
jgi:hypothetical protein